MQEVVGLTPAHPGQTLRGQAGHDTHPSGPESLHGLCQSPRAKTHYQMVSITAPHQTNQPYSMIAKSFCEEQVGTRVLIKNSKCLYTVLLTFA